MVSKFPDTFQAGFKGKGHEVGGRGKGPYHRVGDRGKGQRHTEPHLGCQQLLSSSYPKRLKRLPSPQPLDLHVQIVLTHGIQESSYSWPYFAATRTATHALDQQAAVLIAMLSHYDITIASC